MDFIPNLFRTERRYIRSEENKTEKTLVGTCVDGLLTAATILTVAKSINTTIVLVRRGLNRKKEQAEVIIDSLSAEKEARCKEKSEKLHLEFKAWMKENRHDRYFR